MAQLTIYLDPETQRAIEQAALREGCSLSGWARKRLADAATQTAQAGSLDQLFGAIADSSFAAPPDRGVVDEAPQLD